MLPNILNKAGSVFWRVEKSRRNAEEESWLGTWQEVLHQDEWSNLARIERSAQKHAKSGTDNVGWYDKWQGNHSLSHSFIFIRISIHLSNRNLLSLYMIIYAFICFIYVGGSRNRKSYSMKKTHENNKTIESTGNLIQCH
ncbi:unnamed protein product, partial [Vitis vinifera]|uniref:Uncharacterized protein n=1 Tax=Vitis vinifera TaxID=29760 RepID=D7U522_VITVI